MTITATLTAAEAASALDGGKYTKEGSPELFAAMKAAGLVALFGASDDNMEFRGAIYDEVGCYDGGEVYVDGNGLVQSECDDDDCPYFAREKEKATVIKALWAPDGEPAFSWRYKTDIPHSTFIIYEDEEPFCEGIVFALADVPKEKSNG